MDNRGLVSRSMFGLVSDSVHHGDKDKKPV